MPIASTAHISCSAPLASRRNAERELRPDLGHTRASSRHVPRANQQERSTAAGIFFSVQHTGRNGSVWSLPMLQAGCSRSRPVESSNSRRRAWPSRRFGGPRLPAPLTKCTILPFGILLHCNWAATAGSLAGATLLDSCTAGRLRNCEALNFYSGVLGVAADRNLDVTASGEEANVLVRELDTHAVPLRSSGRVCWASLRHAEGSRAAAPACRLTDAVAPVPVPASRLAI
jgi:hypothetical protein